jgi:hypothetical protein
MGSKTPGLGSRKKASFVPRLALRAAAGVGMSVVPLCVSCSDGAPTGPVGPVIYPASIADAGRDAADANATASPDADAAATDAADAADDGPLGPVIYPPYP